MRSPIVWADQHVLSGVQIILKAGETPALSRPSIVRHRASWRPALAVSSVQQDLDLLHVLELVHKSAPEVPLFSGDDDQTQHPPMGGHALLHAGPLQHSAVRSVGCDRISCETSAATPSLDRVGMVAGRRSRPHEEVARSMPRYAGIQEIVHSRKEYAGCRGFRVEVVWARSKAGTCDRVKTLPDHRTT